MGSAISALLGKKKEEEKNTVKNDSAINRLMSEKKNKPSLLMSLKENKKEGFSKYIGETAKKQAGKTNSFASMASETAKKSIVTGKSNVKKQSTLNKINSGISKFGETLGGFATDVVTSIPKSVVQLGLSGEKLIEGKKEATFVPQSRLGKAILGNQVKDMQTTGKEFLQGVGVKEETAKTYGPTVGVVLALSDLIPGGGGKKSVLKYLAKEDDAAKIVKVLTKTGMNADEVASYAQKIAKTSDTKVIESTLMDIDNLAKTSRKTTAQNALGAIKNEKVVDDTLEAGAKERGFVSSVKAKDGNIKVAGQYIPRSTDELAIKAKNLIKSDIATAEKVAFGGNDENAVATASELIKHYSDEAANATDPAIKNALYDKSASVANDIARKLTEQGRSVQAASILGRLTPEGQVRFAAREIQKYNEAVDTARGGILGIKKKVPELSGAEAENILKEMKEIEAMEDGMEKSMRFKKLQDHISDLVPSDLMTKAVNVWKAGLLTGIKTSGLNIFSNASHIAMETVKDIPASVVDRAASLLTGKRSVIMNVEGTAKGTKEGMKRGVKYLTTGYDERDIATKLDFKRANIKNKVLRAYTDTVFRVLGSEDQPFYYAAKTRSLYEQAKVAAINSKLKGKDAQKFIDETLANPTEEMIKYAAKDAEAAVFQNRTLIGDAAKKIQRIPGGEIVVPFSRTPAAVAMQIINYSPAGAVKTIVENIGKGRFDQRLFSQGMGRAITGTGLLYIGSELYKKGVISLDRPTTEKEQKLWELEGKKANSIKVGDKWRSIQVFGPAGNLFVIGGKFQQSFNDTGSPTAAMTTAITGGMKSFTESTFLQGVSDFTDALSDPEKSGPYYANKTIASIIPTIVSDIARAKDSKERRVDYKDMKNAEALKARIPGVRETLEPQIDVLGNEINRIGNPLEVMADPSRPQKEKTSPVVSEIRRLWDEGYQVSPTLLGDKNGYSTLTPEQNTELWKRSGQILDGKLNNLFNNDNYSKLSDDEKAKLVETFTDKAKIVARAEKALELTEGLQGDELKAKLSELKKDKLLTKDVFDKYMELR
jgi:hypothetical protein